MGIWSETCIREWQPTWMNSSSIFPLSIMFYLTVFFSPFSTFYSRDLVLLKSAEKHILWSCRLCEHLEFRIPIFIIINHENIRKNLHIQQSREVYSAWWWLNVCDRSISRCKIYSWYFSFWNNILFQTSNICSGSLFQQSLWQNNHPLFCKDRPKLKVERFFIL